jgi:hypothetical protein
MVSAAMWIGRFNGATERARSLEKPASKVRGSRATHRTLLAWVGLLRIAADAAQGRRCFLREAVVLSGVVFQ